jgi:protein-disulfide isomerase
MAGADTAVDAGSATVESVTHVFGDPGAPVTVVEFGDYECPYCAGAAPVLRELVTASAGQVRLIFRNFPLFEVHPHALTAALAAESVAASAGEEAFWLMHEKLFVHQSRLNDVDLQLYARTIGGDPELAVGAKAQQFAAQVQSDYEAGLEAGVCSTPTLFIDGVAYSGRIDLTSLRHATAQSASAGTQRRRSPWQRR